MNQQIGLEFEILDPKNCLVSKVKDEGPLWRHEYESRGHVSGVFHSLLGKSVANYLL